MARMNKSGFRRLGPSMYYKQHRDSSSFAIFLVNIPSSKTSLDSIEAAFASFGSIKKIDLDYSKCSPSALIYFNDASSVTRAMDADGVSLWAQFNKPPIDLTSKNVARSLIEQHVGGLPVSDSLQQAADKCMALFEKEEQLEASRRAMRDGPDDDGFVTVTHKRKSKEIERGAAFQKKVKKGKSLELKNFYRHQIREEKKDKLSELRERFEYDKAQIKKLQDSKRFKP